MDIITTTMRELIAALIILFGIDFYVKTQTPEVQKLMGIILVFVGLIFGGFLLVVHHA
jgi:hypothetical protein